MGFVKELVKPREVKPLENHVKADDLEFFDAGENRQTSESSELEILARESSR
ncbi:MAG: hypothetical protein ACFE7R_08260 [Candidatus Hodarchaeota archaeon]